MLKVNFRALTSLQRVKDGDLTVMFPYDNRAFTNLQYCKVKTKTFKSIQNKIRDIEGEPIPFASPGIVKKLHFRKKSLSYLKKWFLEKKFQRK